MKPEDFLELTLKAARAGAAVLAARASFSPATGRIETDSKSAAGDWVTEFDRNAEQAVREILHAARPHDEISGEEYETTTVENPSGYRWSIDPLDGTVNFVRGIPFFGCSVAVFGPADHAPEGAWLAGAVVAPALNVEYFATRGGGAWMRTTHDDDAAPVRLHGPDKTSDARILATGLGYDAARRAYQVAALAEMLPGFANIRRLGSAALDLCLVAEGKIDAYAEFGTQEFDWAAGALIAEESGTPVRRPASGDGTRWPDWMVAGQVNVPKSPRRTPDPQSILDDPIKHKAEAGNASGVVVVRDALPDDYLEIRRITHDAYISGGYFGSAEEPYMQRVGNVSDRHEDALMWVAERDGQVVGSVTIARAGEKWADIAREDELEFRLLAVDPNVQRSGAGSALVERIVAYAKTLPDVNRVSLTTGADWLPAHALYERLGFTRVPDRDWFVPGTDIKLIVYVYEIAEH
ncbi:fructose-1,6-bisphosphatase/inositol monophosphatase family enzyme/GNAT superfamily N-acetyltransferase [Neomicrococcus aestuarii]|uniref:Fructose-1,6-bisphosphatase/inositol monophosphatase family enzyme/GNAT superfamily N-acetyltransferase n=1 Tax=Neomicrococcus aestuarii TaxID=556325 RepID=A0A7W8TRB0_9MICC|nr:inositol monophosphatase family protein [Neomicrococcus aestuarii]MBB5511481.1 fructose-1,6-bisphosphatase/inositol monophosphatase family enzyme/GNAT superfamily N-acetyltransferase [Neomicrococcus aestuarii]